MKSWVFFGMRFFWAIEGWSSLVAKAFSISSCLLNALNFSTLDA
jgi:hypothetical protein